MEITMDYLAVGGNRHPSAADWNAEEDLLAYGAGKNLALWKCSENRGLHALLRGHHGKINAVRFFCAESTLLATGCENGHIGLWAPDKPETSTAYKLQYFSECHDRSIECLGASNELPGLLVSGSADGTIKTWKVEHLSTGISLSALHTIVLKKAIIPLTLALFSLDSKGAALLVGGTSPNIFVYVQQNENWVDEAILTGHEGWIRSLVVTRDVKDHNADLLLASASQDKHIRVWRICQSPETFIQSTAEKQDDEYNSSKAFLSNRMHCLRVSDATFVIMLEALLIGHDDWVYSLQWSMFDSKLQLLSASADNTILTWKVDLMDGIWHTDSRLGEVSVQKGSTSATGTTGGLWCGIWGKKARTIFGLARTGSWLKWECDLSGSWQQGLGLSGHIKSVQGLSWSQDGAYLLSTSADQTTRLHCEWLREDLSSWHEFSRPQIHGYDINCINTLGNHSFVSGADEKLLRVFEEPDNVVELLNRLCQVKASSSKSVLAAGIPVLGLSNKAAEVTNGQNENGSREDHNNSKVFSYNDNLILSRPPLEDHLSKHSLWPEKEKLYGHGFEIHALAVSHDNSIIASSCKASSMDHAVIRLFSTHDWKQIHPPLKAHTLTVTGLQFSKDSRFLLSVGRDRQWVVWERDSATEASYSYRFSESRAHTRMILSESWITFTNISFATGGRDRLIKMWQISDAAVRLEKTIEVESPVLTLSVKETKSPDRVLLAAGLETGEIYLCGVGFPSFHSTPLCIIDNNVNYAVGLAAKFKSSD